MRILNVTQSYAPFFEFGGPPAKVKALAEGMARRGHDVTVLTADWGLEKRMAGVPGAPRVEASPFGRRTRVNGVTAVYLPNWAHVRALSWNPALGRYLRARFGEFDVAHLFGLYDLLGPRVAQEARRRKIPYVVEPIGMFLPIVRNVGMKKAYHALYGRRMLEGAEAIVVTAEQERQEVLSGGFSQKKVILRRNGVEAPESLPERGNFRRSQGIPSGQLSILFLGRLSQKKSPDLLLRAFAGLPDASAHLTYVGPDESGMRERLQVGARDLKVGARVHFVEALEGERKWEAYRDADVFVLPSQNENFGNTAAEAIVAGTPVIVTEKCGIAPLLGEAGLVVKHDEQALRAALSAVLHDAALRERMQTACTVTAAHLGWEEPLEELERLYSKLATKGSA